MSLSGIRSDLQTALATITSMRVFDSIPDTINTFPAAVIIPRPPIVYNSVAANNLAKADWEVTVIVLRWGDVNQSQRELDDYLERTGTKSVKAALEAGTSSNWKTINVSEATYYGPIIYNDVPLYLGVKFLVETWF